MSKTPQHSTNAKQGEQRLEEQKHIRFVLVETTHPGNIGGSARAMKTMGLSELGLVQPKTFPHEMATAMAVSAADLLETAQQFESLAEAVADCHLVIGTSARDRHLRLPILSPTQAAQEVAKLDQSYRAAIVFGRESSGLSNEELDLCHYLVHIPCNPDFRSLNLASAVQILSYEIAQHTLFAAMPASEVDPTSVDACAPSVEVERFFAHLEEVLTNSNFLKSRQSATLLRRLRKLFHRTHLTQREVNILRGMIQALADKPAE